MLSTTACVLLAEECEFALLRSIGASELEHRIIRVHFETQHLRPALYEDPVTMHITVNRVGTSSIHYDFTIFSRGAVASTGRWGDVHLGETGRPSPIPAHLRAALLTTGDQHG
ncbi:acyl-CoA thioesterase [Amycolatopsis jejuensis]|uniref:acyl-CoA thioesterase n=1 Tax=Amycolatopsis jejuensis TaxID=330084 RepID=UPI000A75A67F|nr:hotdog domain-containing protein [Amycolatopsis jejuensis]